MQKILVINPGSTSTKIAVYDAHQQLWQEDIIHDGAALHAYPTIFAQKEFRLPLVIETYQNHGDKLEELACVMSRGGLLPPLASGAYEINECMLDVLEHRPMNHHASNLGAAIAYEIATPLGIRAYIYDPVTVDEMIDLVRITGLKEIRRHGQGHNLNMRAAALKYCRENGQAYDTQNLIVAHLGGGITLSLHSQGRIIDMVSDDEGPFSPERAGLMPAFKLVKLIDKQQLNYKDTMSLLQRQGGLTALLGTADAREVEKRIAAGDEYAALVLEAMTLGVAESIARLSVVVSGRVDAILLTGGIAHSARVTEWIAGRVRFIAPVHLLPGENEMQALADGACRILSGEEAAKPYVEPENYQF